MTAPRRGRLRRLLADLRRPETRTDAVRRVRRRVGGVVPGGTKRTGARPAGAKPGGATPRRRDAAADRSRSGGRARPPGAPAQGRGGPRRGHRARRAPRAGRLPERDRAHRRGRVEPGLGDGRGRRPAGRRGHRVDAGARGPPAPAPPVRPRLVAGRGPGRRRPRDVHPGGGGRRGAGRRDRRGAPARARDLVAGRPAAGERPRRPRGPLPRVRRAASRAGELVAELRRRSSLDLDDRRRRSWQLIEGWLAQRPVAVPQGSIPVAILDYQTPDHVLTSGNLGDYVQTLALLGNLARLSDVAFTGDDGLGDARHRAPGAGAAFAPSPRSDGRRPPARGRSRLQQRRRRSRPARGWSRSAGTCTRCTTCATTSPTTPTSGRCSSRSTSTGWTCSATTAQAYLRAHGPIGCRDWNTVFLLLSAGIDAFFTGCLDDHRRRRVPGPRGRLEAHRGASA